MPCHEAGSAAWARVGSRNQAPRTSGVRSSSMPGSARGKSKKSQPREGPVKSIPKPSKPLAEDTLEPTWEPAPEPEHCATSQAPDAAVETPLDPLSVALRPEALQVFEALEDSLMCTLLAGDAESDPPRVLRRENNEVTETTCGTTCDTPRRVLGTLSAMAGACTRQNRTAGTAQVIATADGVGAEAQAVVVLSGLAHGQQAAARHAISALRKVNQQAPIVAVLMRQPGETVEASVVLEAHKQFAAAHADETVLMGHSKDETRLAVWIGMQRASERRSLIMWYKQDLQQWEDRNIRMFWPCVQELFPEFPKMMQNATTYPETGAKIGQHTIGPRLGHGMFAQVYASMHGQKGRKDAIKVVAKSKVYDIAQVRHVWNELRLLRQLQHPNIVGFRGCTHARHFVYIFMEHAGPRSLYKAIRAAGGRLPPKTAQLCFAQISSSMAYCHGQGVAHLDLKPENMVIREDGCLKIVDFGMAVELDKQCRESCGTMPFVAPEVLQHTPFDASLADVWSAGVVLLEMLCGVGRMCKILNWEPSVSPKPERADELAKVFANPEVLNGSLRNALGHHMSESLQVLTQSMLCVSPGQRWTFAQCEESPWVMASYYGARPG